eukprot:SAG25_NODE_311_length_10005_cov_9.395720_6_plen_318_part_00
MLAGFSELHAMIGEIWSDTSPADRPKIIGPDNDFRWSSMRGNLTTSRVLESMAPYLHAFTYHRYGGGGETDARAFEVYASDSTAGGVPDALLKQLAPETELWLGEGGGTGCSEGQPEPGHPLAGVTHQLASNEAVDMYWWLDALGDTAVHGHQRFLRETLAGGWYGITNLTSMEVYGDYYAALLFSRLMGPTVLSTSVTQIPKPTPSSPVRSYAHCHRQGQGLTVLLINLGPRANVTITDSLGASATAAPYEIYRLNPGPEGKTGHQVALNNKILKLGQGGKIPPMASVEASAPVIEMAPLDIVFAVVRHLLAPACE